MKNILALTCFTVLCASQTMAATQVYQSLMPNKGQSDARVTLGYGIGDATTKDNVTETEFKNAQASLSYHYGLLDNHAVGLNLGYSMSENKYETGLLKSEEKYNGLTNATVDYKMLHDLSADTNLFGKLAYTMALEKPKYDLDKNEGNNAFAQSAINLELGINTAATQEVIWGALVNYSKKFEVEKTYTTAGFDSTAKIKRGDAMGVSTFFELSKVEFRPNVAIGFLRDYTKSEVDAAGATTETITMNYLTLQASAQFKMTESFTLLPEFKYTKLESGLKAGGEQDPGLHKLDTLNTAFTARFLF